MAALVEASKSRNTGIRKNRFACLDDNGVQRHIKNSAPYGIYINCCYHRHTMCFKQLISIHCFSHLILCSLVYGKCSIVSARTDSF